MFTVKPFYKAGILLLLLAGCDQRYQRSSGKEELISSIRTKDSSGELHKETDQQLNTEDYDNIVENSFLAAVQNPLSAFSIDVDRAAYSNVRRFIKSGTMPPKGSADRRDGQLL
jgi:hypothetical protein